MKRIIRFTALFSGVIIMLALFGCGKQKYNLNYDGYGFESKKTVYSAGDKVTVRYGLIATDTDYRFWIDDDVEMSRGYNNDDGYVFTFTMPDHDVTLHVESHNSMLDTKPENIRVTFVNNVETADVWILPQTEENLKSSLWGTASAENLGANEQREITLTKTEESYIVRIIDDGHAYYSVKDVLLENGYTIRFAAEGSKFDAVIEVLDADGTVLKTQTAFEGMLGAQ